VSATEVQCEMPFLVVDIEVRYTSITWIVSVSNDNVTFSETRSVFVYDSECLMCGNDTASCQQKASGLVLRILRRLTVKKYNSFVWQG